ncbi:MAG: sulfatase-like hydrolase/transferase [Chloroflexota bacterium]|nr:sulfatase-like hydrolase/transferase [Chloroflexota bacterium]
MTERKNILLIITDQQRYDTLGCYGAPTCRTPHIDGLAERGVRFDAAYTATSPCSPARAALFTGLYPHKNHVRVNNQVLNPDVPNLASALGDAGYNLGYAGKWHVDEARVPTDYGFQGKDFPGYGYPAGGGVIQGLRFGASGQGIPHYPAYLEEHGYEAPEVLKAFYGSNPGTQGQEIYALQSGTVETTFEYMVSELAIDLMRQFKEAWEREGKPFFLWVNFWGPHTPCLLPEEYYSMYDPTTIPPEPSFAENWSHKPRAHALYERYWGLSEGGWESWREIVARYWGYVTMIDDLVGRMVEALQGLGMEKDTMIIFGTDHGDMMGAHRMIEKGPFAYEESWRLPLVVAHPDCETPGTICDEFVYLQDLYPTFLEMAGIAPPEVPDTQSILNNVLGRKTPTDRESVYGAFHSHIFPTPLRFVRTRTHKLVYNRCDRGELYSLIDDPWELHNLMNTPEMAATQQQLMERLRQYMIRLDDPIQGAFDRIRHVY